MDRCRVAVRRKPVRREVRQLTVLVFQTCDLGVTRMLFIGQLAGPRVVPYPAPAVEAAEVKIAGARSQDQSQGEDQDQRSKAADKNVLVYVWGKPARWSSWAKRGSERMGSHNASTLR